MSTFFTKKRILARYQALEQRRSPHIADWKKITDVIRPARGNFLDGNDTEASKRPTSMLNSTPAVASRTLQAGMISGASSPAYEWFKLYLDDAEMMKWGPARVHLEIRERLMYQHLARSNFYQNLQVTYGDSADFGTGVGIIQAHRTEHFAAKVFAPGEYVIDVDELGDIDTIIRRAPRTALQLMSVWPDKVSTKVRQAYDKGDYNTPFIVIECIEPNQDFDEDRGDWRGKPWAKFVFEEAEKAEGESAYLEVSGYEDWPGFNLRWDIASGNNWGWGPGLLALGDAAALQTLEFRHAQAIEKAVKPPLGAPIGLKNKPISHAPGGVTYWDPFASGANAEIKPLYLIQPGVLQALNVTKSDLERRVNEVYFKDLFLMLATTDRREITAREVEEKHQEKLLALGPVLQRTHRDALNNAIIRVYKILDRAGVFPPPPAELRERLIGVRYTSALAFAQRAAGAASLERFFGFTGNIAAAYPDVRHKVNINKGMDYYADAIGVPAEVMNADDVAQKGAQAERQAMAAKEQAGALKDTAGAAQLLSQTDTARPSALSFLMDRAGGGGLVQ